MHAVSSEAGPVVANSTHAAQTPQSAAIRMFAVARAESAPGCARASGENSLKRLQAARNRASERLVGTIVLLIKDMLPAQNRPMTRPAMGVMRLARQRENRMAASAVVMVVLAAILGACSADLSLNNLTLTPKPDGLPKNSDWAQAWGRSSSGTVTTADLVSSRGQCPLPPLAPGQSAMAGQAQAAQAELGGIALEMSECEVVHRTGPVEKMEVANRTRRALPRAHLSQGSLAWRVSLYCGPPGIDRASAGCPGAVHEGSHPQQKTRRTLNVRPRST